MTITELTLRLLLLFFPGIICYLATDVLTVHRERKTYEVLFLTYLFGMLSYLLYSLALCLFGLRIVTDGDSLRITCISAGPLFFRSVSNTANEVDFWEIGFVAAVALVVAYLWTFAHRKHLLHWIAEKLNVTDKFGEPDVWNHSFQKGVHWCIVRDMTHELMYQGYVQAYSDVEENAELLLTDVIVYNEKTAEECYRAEMLYLSRKKDDLTIQFQLIREVDADVEASSPTEASGERISGPDNEGNREAGGPEPTKPEHVEAAEAEGQLSAAEWREIVGQWKEIVKKLQPKPRNRRK